MADKPDKIEMSPYNLAKKIVAERNINTIYLRKINGRLYHFSWEYKCFVATRNEDLETGIISYMERLLDQDPDLDVKITKKFVQDTVFFIKRCLSMKKIARNEILANELLMHEIPAEYMGWMGFKNGFLNVNDFKFTEYNSAESPIIYSGNIDPNRLPSITYAFPQKYDPLIQSRLFDRWQKCQDQAKYAYNSHSASQLFFEETPYFSQFLDRITNGNFILQDRIWEMIGYILAPDTNGKVFFLLQGVPNSGKSILGRLIASFFPEGLVTSLTANRLGDRFAPPQMNTCRLNMSMDLPNGRLNESAVANIKMITGGDLIAHEEKYKDTSASRWTCKLLFSTNHPLTLKKYDPAFWKRIVCIPFRNEIPKQDQDANLFYRLLPEQQYIINKAIFCYSILKIRKYQFSDTNDGSFEPMITYLLGADEVIEEFMKECCSFTTFEDGRTTTEELHKAYSLFCSRNGFTPVGTKSFSQKFHKICGDRIEDYKWRVSPDTSPLNGYRGVVLIGSEDTDSMPPYSGEPKFVRQITV